MCLINLLTKKSIYQVVSDNQLSLNTLRFQRKPFQKSLITIPTRSPQITEHLSPLVDEQPETSSIANIAFERGEM